MFQLNPLELPNAWWQHGIILVISGIIGYIIAYRTGKNIHQQLEERLAWMEVNLEKCRTNLINTTVAPLRQVPSAIGDDLKIIEGIGPAIERILYRAGIHTYPALSRVSPETITEILIAANRQLQMHDPASWPRQASFAALGQWKELREWQEKLDAGKA